MPATASAVTQVWKALGCRCFSDYVAGYLAVDVLGLADVVETFRRHTLDEFGIDPLHCVSAASLSWNAALRYTKCDIELIRDHDQYLFFEASIRGGLSNIATRAATAANPLVWQQLPEAEAQRAREEAGDEWRYLFYEDCNSLYAYAMKQPLPCGGFRWREDAALPKPGELAAPAEGRGYVVEVDLRYPPELHDAHDDYPLAVQRRTVGPEELSAHSRAVLAAQHAKHQPCPKLIADFSPREHYVLHHSALLEYVSHGLVVTKVRGP